MALQLLTHLSARAICREVTRGYSIVRGGWKEVEKG